MQSFRARSQLLVSRLEDGDEVLHQMFSDDEEDGDIGADAENVDRREAVTNGDVGKER